MTHTLVVGYGSIGQRHSRILHEAGHTLAVLSRRTIIDHPCYSDLEIAIAEHQPSYVVIANETAGHRDTVAKLAQIGFQGDVLVEKPLFETELPVPENHFRSLHCAYHFRFHPLLERLRIELKNERIITYTSYVGQYLPDWRPGADYRASYSARAEDGGGVLADLSHELDFALWLLGGWTAVAARGGRFSDLEITSDDCFALLLETPRCNLVSLQMSYLDRSARREIVVNTSTSTYYVDLIRGTFQKNATAESMQTDRDIPYLAMHLSILGQVVDGGPASQACTDQEALAVLRLIDSARTSATRYEWRLN